MSETVPVPVMVAPFELDDLLQAESRPDVGGPAPVRRATGSESASAAAASVIVNAEDAVASSGEPLGSNGQSNGPNPAGRLGRGRKRRRAKDPATVLFVAEPRPSVRLVAGPGERPAATDPVEVPVPEPVREPVSVAVMEPVATVVVEPVVPPPESVVFVADPATHIDEDSVEETSAPRHRRQPRRERRRRRVPIWLVAVVVFVLLVGGAGIFVESRLSSPLSPGVVTSLLAPTVRVGGSTTALPWAAGGQSAIAVPSIGIDVASGPETAAPVASLTKMMTAYVVLHDHPLRGNANGPNITMTQADLDDFNNDAVQDQSNAQVTLGEVLTERQLLGGMLVHSADNYATTLARWDAGSLAAFIQKMNQAAAALGMHDTHYTDASGFDPGSQSTAADQLRVAGWDMSNPAFESIVDATSITLPVVGTITSYTPLIGTQGVIGVKSGFTTQAGGNDVLAVVRRSHRLPVLILGAVTGQQGPGVLLRAGQEALALADVVSTNIGATTIVRSGTVVAHVRSDGHTVNATVRGTANVLSWPGIVVHRVFVKSGPIPQGAKAGTKVGTVIVTVGTQRVELPVRLTHALAKETTSQRIF